MVMIEVPRPPASAMNPDRPASSLLLAQVAHLQHAERRLPLKYRTEMYAHAIRTEGEASKYIQAVTEAIHRAHEDAAAARAKGRSQAAKKAAKRPARRTAVRSARKTSPKPKVKSKTKTTGKKKAGQKK